MMAHWYYDDGLMDEVKQLVSKSKELLDKPRKSNSEIAVFVSCEALYYVNKKSDIIDKADPDRYKLFIFPDAFYLKDAQRDYINRVVKKNGT